MKHIARSTLIVAFFFGLEKVLGFLRYFLIAHQFGLSPELDAFNAANNIPDLIFSLISGGSLALAFYSRANRDTPNPGSIRCLGAFLPSAQSGLRHHCCSFIRGSLFAPFIVRAQIGIVPGFNPQEQDLWCI